MQVTIKRHDYCQFYVRGYDLKAGVVMDHTRQKWKLPHRIK